MSSIHEAETWFTGAEILPETPLANDVRAIGLLIGLQLEAMGTKIAGITAPVGDWMRQYGLMFRSGEMDQLIREAIAVPERREALLQGDLNVLWNTAGAARALGANVGDAFAAMVDANWKKEWPDGTFHLDEQSQAEAPEGWVPPDYKQFLAP